MDITSLLWADQQEPSAIVDAVCTGWAKVCGKEGRSRLPEPPKAKMGKERFTAMSKKEYDLAKNLRNTPGMEGFDFETLQAREEHEKKMMDDLLKR